MDARKRCKEITETTTTKLGGSRTSGPSTPYPTPDPRVRPRPDITSERPSAGITTTVEPLEQESPSPDSMLRLE